MDICQINFLFEEYFLRLVSEFLVIYWILIAETTTYISDRCLNFYEIIDKENYGNGLDKMCKLYGTISAINAVACVA